MALVVYSQSRSFEAHIGTVIDADVSFRSRLSPPIAGAGNVYLVHGASFPRELPAWLASACQKGAVIGVAADTPQLEDLLAYTEIGVQGYFNAYMAAPHYAQMCRLLANGQSWFPPALLSQAFDLARSAMRPAQQQDPLQKLTKREREVALAVAAGNSNKRVANRCNISERTVKTHLTQIFKKLQVKDRVALVIYLNQFDGASGRHSSLG